MANIKSQKKRVLTNEKARLRNKAAKASLRTSIKAVDAAVESGDKEAASVAFSAASRKLDKAATKKLVHKNSAANKKSALAHKVNAL
ncbi:MAG: 30S ribosomal protein S20 [Bifidobacteriaceae bacterium]|jgi:small subunit ribosomal protein S20|nr:30S ribosomal protein S20 [Bifidobacteriaceae bacterium]